MPITYKKIASVTVTGATATDITFTSIPGTYTDLVVHVSARTDTARASGGFVSKIEFNGLNTNLSSRWIRGNGSAASSGTETYIYGIATGASNDTASTFGNSTIYIPNYAGSTNKSVSVDGVEENNATESYAILTAGLWSSTSAITSIKISPAVGLYVTNSSATLYGISKS